MKKKLEDVLVRQASRKDIPQIVGNWKLLIKGTEAYFPKALRLKPNAAGIYRKYLAMQIGARKASVFVAEKDGKIMGHAMVEMKPLPPVYVTDREAYVVELFVKKAWRSRGIGKLLLSKAESWGKRMGLRQLGLTSNVKNSRARRVYSSFGMKEIVVKMIKRI